MCGARHHRHAPQPVALGSHSSSMSLDEGLVHLSTGPHHTTEQFQGTGLFPRGTKVYVKDTIESGMLRRFDRNTVCFSAVPPPLCRLSSNYSGTSFRRNPAPCGGGSSLTSVPSCAEMPSSTHKQTPYVRFSNTRCIQGCHSEPHNTPTPKFCLEMPGYFVKPREPTVLNHKGYHELSSTNLVVILVRSPSPNDRPRSNVKFWSWNRFRLSS